MSIKRLFIFADEKEAQATLESPYLKSEDRVVISGWGAKLSFEATMRYGEDVDEIINLGIAGSLNDHTPLFTLCPVKSVGGQDRSLFTLQGKGARLYTSDLPLHDQKLRDELGLNWDLVDMEGHAIVEAAKKLGKPVRLYKIVSDFAKEETKSMVLLNLKKCSELLAKVLKYENEGCLPS